MHFSLSCTSVGWDSQNIFPRSGKWALGYSDYDVFKENYRCKKDSFVTQAFQNYEPFLANGALKYLKNANMT